MTSIGTFTDNFAFATAQWAFVGGSTITGGQLQIPVVSAYDQAFSQAQYDLTGSAAYVQLVQTPNLGNGTTEAGLVLEIDSNNSEQIGYSGGALFMRERATGSNSDTTLTFDAVNHKWLRLRESGGTVFWDTSPDGVTWTNRRSKAAGITLTSLTVSLFSGYYGTEPSPGTAIFDNFNTLGVSSGGFFQLF